MTQILVVTNSYDDPHVEAVREEVEAHGSTLVRLDSNLLVSGISQITFDYQDGFSTVTITNPNGVIKSHDIDSVWLRKPYGFGDVGFVESIVDPVQRAVAEKELTATLGGLFAILEDRYWLNRPYMVERAKLKPYQLFVARKVGLVAPETIITCEPLVAKAFCSQGPTVFKPLSQALLKYQDQTLSVETTLMTDAHIGNLDLIRSQPVLLQRCIDKLYELRVTYVHGQLFVARQELTSTHVPRTVDWRSLQGTPESIYLPGEVSADTARKIKLLMQELNLGYGALDFAVDQDGNEYFLEVNPNGQWLGYTEKIGLPAAAEIAHCLIDQSVF